MSIEALDFDTLIADKYRPIEWVGKGAMGRVLKAEDVTLDDLPVAIKFLAWQSEGDDEKKRDLFQREMHAMVELYAHSYIVQVHDFGWLTDGTPYMVMGFMPHGSLKGRLEVGQLEPSLNRRVLEELCDALDYIHEQNIVHLDLKPSNILFDRRDHVRISDFGLARLTDGVPTDFAAAGTPGYMAPEQMRGGVAVDHRADVYALGVIAWQLFTGQHPSESEALSAGTLVPELAQALRKAFAQDPVDRYDSANEFLKAIKPWLPRTYPAGVVTADARFGFLVTQVPFTYRENVRRVLEDYTTVFGGREPEMEALDDWLSAPDQSCGIMQAPAGRGKTALLVNWALGVQGSGEWRVVFHPISVRYQTADANTTMRCLAHALAPLFDAEPPGPNQSPDVIRPQVTEWLRHGLPEDEQLLVIVDGLDEAVGWPVESLFPRTPGPGVRLLVSARPLAGTDRLAWTTRLKWDVAATQFFDLGGIDRAALTEMLRVLPDEKLSALADDDAFVAELARVSEGDPLTARMIVDGLRVGDLTPQALSRRPPGLKAYLEDWLRELEDRAESEAVWRLLGLCAVALGPLTAEDLAALAPDVFKTGRHIRGAVRAVERFILGDGTPGSGYVFSHPRLREFFGDELLASERATYQAAFIDYGQRAFEGLPDVPCPAYVRQFWMTHLAEAGEWQTLHELVSTGDDEKQPWAEARYAAEGSYAGYLSDLSLVWAHADEDGLSERQALGWQVRYALIESSLHSLVSNIPASLLLALVKYHPDWTVETGLDHARQTPDPKQRAETLIGLLPHLPESEHTEAMKESMAAVRATLEEDRVRALAKLAPHLSGPLLPEALAVARTIRFDPSRAAALTGIAPYLPELLLREALTAAREIGDEGSRVGALTGLVPHLPGPLLQEALKAARATGWKSLRIWAFAKMAFHLPLSSRVEVLREALTAAQAIRDEMDRAQALMGLAVHLPEPLKGKSLREALAAGLAIRDEDDRAQVLAGLRLHVPNGLYAYASEALPTIELARGWPLDEIAPHLPEPLLKEVLAAVRTIGEKQTQARAWAMAGLAPYLQEPERTEVLQEAVTAAWSTEDGTWRVETMIRLFPHLPEPQRTEVLAEVLATVRVTSKPEWRTRTLVEIASHLPESLKGEVLREALAAARAIDRKYRRAEVLSNLAPQMPESLRDEALREALATAREFPEQGQFGRISRAEALARLTPHLSDPERIEVLQEALAVTRLVRDQDDRMCALARLASYLHKSLLPKVMVAAQAIRDAGNRVEALAALAPHLPEPERGEALQEALAAAREIEQERTRAVAMVRLAPHLSEQLLQEALTAVHGIEDEYAQAEALAGLASHLPESLRKEMLEAARAIRNEYSRAEALTKIAPHLAEPEHTEALVEALAAARATREAYGRAKVLVRLAPHLPKSLLLETLAAVRVIGDDYRAEALAGLIRYLPESLRDDVLQEALAAMRAIEDEHLWAVALVEMAPYLPGSLLLDALTAAQAIVDGDDWVMALAGLAPHLPEPERTETLQETLEAVQTFEAEEGEEETQVHALARLAPHLSESLLPEALATVQSIKSEDDRAKALIELAPYLSASLLQGTLVAAREIGWESARAEALSGMAPHLAVWAGKDRETIYAAWIPTLHALAARTRRDLLSDLHALAPAIAALGGPETLTQTAKAIFDVGRWWP